MVVHFLPQELHPARVILLQAPKPLPTSLTPHALLFSHLVFRTKRLHMLGDMNRINRNRINLAHCIQACQSLCLTGGWGRDKAPSKKSSPPPRFLIMKGFTFPNQNHIWIEEMMDDVLSLEIEILKKYLQHRQYLSIMNHITSQGPKLLRRYIYICTANVSRYDRDIPQQLCELYAMVTTAFDPFLGGAKEWQFPNLLKEKRKIITSQRALEISTWIQASCQRTQAWKPLTYQAALQLGWRKATFDTLDLIEPKPRLSWQEFRKQYIFQELFPPSKKILKPFFTKIQNWNAEKNKNTKGRFPVEEGGQINFMFPVDVFREIFKYCGSKSGIQAFAVTSKTLWNFISNDRFVFRLMECFDDDVEKDIVDKVEKSSKMRASQPLYMISRYFIPE